MISFKLFESHQDIHDLCNNYDIKNYTINDDGSVSVDSGVNLNNKQLAEIPIPFKEVDGDFYCGNNQLTSLKGCPETVGGNFYCGYNQLTSLKYCPETVGGDFSCSENQLTSLEGCPETVGGNFYCNDNQLTNFDGLPEFFEQDIYLYRNPVYEIYDLFRYDPRCIYWLREYDVIRGNIVIRDRLEEVLHTLDMNIPDNLEQLLGPYYLIQ